MLRRSTTARTLVGAALVSLLGSSSVLAQPADESATSATTDDLPVSLELVAPAGCGSKDDLAARIAWRTSRVRFVEVSASERRLEVAVEVGPAAATATLTLTLPNGRRATRTIRAASCDEAIDAAALVAAVTLDPTASIVPSKGATTGAAGAGGAAGSAAAAGAAQQPPASAHPPNHGGDAGTAVRASPPSTSELSGSLFAVGEVVVAAAPRELWGFGAGAMGVWDRGSVLSPALRLSYAHFFARSFDELGGTATFSLDVVTADLCPIRVGVEGFGAFLCGTVTGGSLLAVGSKTTAPQDRPRPWWVIGGTLLVQWRPIWPLELQSSLALGHPLLRDAFQFDPEVFYEVSSPSLTAGLALGVFFR